MKCKYVPDYLLTCCDADFYQYIKSIEVEKENMQFEQLQQIGLELIQVLYLRNRNSACALSECTMSMLTRQLTEHWNILQE